MKKVIIFLIKVYQKIPGPWHLQCRHIPTCYNYAITAIDRFGIIKGSYLSIKRIIHCNPLYEGGIDLVPIKENKKWKRKNLNYLY